MKTKMLQKRFLIITILGLAMLWIPQLAQAWPTDPTVNVPICTETGDQLMRFYGTVSDGSGGAITTWEDVRGGTYDIYAQRVDADGNALWTAGGVAISTASGHQRYPVIVSDGSGGAIIVWQDNRASTWDIYAQRVDASGTSQWTADGEAISPATHYQESPAAVSDGSGGVVILWLDNRNGNTDIYAQRVDASGTVLWTSDAPICTEPSNQGTMYIASDGAGGAIISWNDQRSGYNIYAQRVEANGNIPYRSHRRNPDAW